MVDTATVLPENLLNDDQTNLLGFAAKNNHPVNNVDTDDVFLTPAMQMEQSFKELMKVLREVLDSDNHNQHWEAVVSNGWSMGLRPLRALLESNIINLDDILSILQIIKKAVRLTPNKVDWEIADLLPSDVREQFMLLPYSLSEDGDGVINIAHPHTSLSAEADEVVCNQLGGAQWRLMWCDAEEIESCLETRKYQVIAATDSLKSEQVVASSEMWRKLTDSPHPDDVQINAMIAEILARASLDGASDIHIEPELDEDSGGKFYVIRFRLLGILTNSQQVTWINGERIINRFRVSSNVREQPTLLADSRFTVNIAGNAEYHLRISYVPTAYGPSMVLRLLPATASATQSLDDIWPKQHTTLASQIRGLLHSRPDGIILVAGRTGDGKSTTLAAMLNEMCDGKRKVVTAENPVEYRIAGAQQVEVREWAQQGAVQTGFPTWGNVLRSFLRSDPDVIMIGEIRDADTADIAIRAAQTGHLVFSTVHVRDAAAAPSRLLDMVPGNEAALADTLNGVLAQRLLRKSCLSCRRKKGLSEKCANCKGSRWDGRIAVGELLVVNEKVQQAILQPSAPATAIRDVVGMGSLLTMLSNVLRSDVTTAEEIERIYGSTMLANVKAWSDQQ